MSKRLDLFISVSGMDGITVADNGSLRCTAIKLKGDGLCLFSPVKGLNSKTLGSLQKLGQVEYLLAPNHYHNLALQEYLDHFPSAVVCAPSEALPRLEKVTGLKIADLTGLKNKLPESAEIIQTTGLKTGEIWLRVQNTEEVCWLVVDAFCGPNQQAKKKFSSTPQLLKPFPKYGVGDRLSYIDWVKARIETDRPTTVIPCHGAMLRSKQLPKKLHDLVSKQL